MKILRQSTFVLVGALAGFTLPILPVGALELALGPEIRHHPLQVIWLAMPFIGGALGARIARKTERQ